MGFGLRKRIKIASGLHLNIGKKCTSFSVGRPGASGNIGGKRGPRATVGIPGTGLSHTSKLSSESPETETQHWVETKSEGISALRLFWYLSLALFLYFVLSRLFFS